MTETVVGELVEETKPTFRYRSQAAREAEEGQVLDLLVRGYTQREIARELGVALRTVANRREAALARIIPTKVEDYRAVMREQLDHLFRACVMQLEAGDATAIDRALKVLDRRAKLDSLDAPQQVEATVVHTTAQELELRTLLDAAAAAVADAETKMKAEAL